MIKQFIFLLSILLLLSCKKSDDGVDFGYEYFPIKEGSFVLYEVKEIFHDKDLIPQHDTVTYHLKRKVGEVVLDNLGRKAHKFFLTRYDALTGDKIDERVWTKIIDEGRGEVVEENQRKIRMVFAVKEDKEWDVNAFNPEAEEKVSYKDIGESLTTNGKYFKETVRVHYNDYLTLVDYIKKDEVYAKNVGLVKRSFKDLKINNFDTLNISKGTEIHYTLLQYGKE